MMDASTLTRLNDSCTAAARGYTLASSAMCASLAASMIEAWVDGIDSIGRTSSDQPARSWYRHPDKRSFAAPSTWPSPSEATASACSYALNAPAAFNPMALFMVGFASRTPATPQTQRASTASQATGWPFMPPIVGWWSLQPTRHPLTTWPMAHFLEASGVPKPVAWPFAEANSAAFDAFSICAEAWSKAAAAASIDTAHPPQSAEAYPATRSSARTQSRAIDSFADSETSSPTRGIEGPAAVAWFWPVAGATFMAALCDGLQTQPSQSQTA